MVKKYLAYFTAVAGRDILLAALTLLALGLTEGIGLMMLIPFLAIIGISEQQITESPVTQKWLELAESTGIPLNLVSLLIVFVLLIALKEYFLRLQAIQTNHIQQKIINRFRSRLYQALVYSNWLFFTRERSSDMTQTLTADINRIGLMVLIGVRMASAMVLTCVYLVASLLVSVEMTLITMASASVLLWVSRSKFRIANRLGESFTNHNNEMYGLIGESLAGIKTAKCFSAEQQQVKGFSRNLERLYEVHRETCKSRANARVIFGLGSAVILASFLFVAIEFLKLPATSILLLVFLFSRLSPKVSALQQDSLRLLNALPALKSYDGMLVNAQSQNEGQCEGQNEEQVLSVPVESISLSKLSFSYQPSHEIAANTLTDIDLTIAIGQSVAIVGQSGSGKSTVADILMGLIYPTSGAVCLDGKPLNQQQLIQWRKQIAYVSQDPHFLHDSVRNNLLWCKSGATEQELIKALKRASAWDFVKALPQGLDTIIGDRGSCLSGGERQRLAIARALLFEPTLLILDEATSGLDENTQSNIMAQLALLKGEVTVVMITHRLSVLEMFDCVYIMDSGKLAVYGGLE